jgi:hypothetical protein
VEQTLAATMETKQTLSGFQCVFAGDCGVTIFSDCLAVIVLTFSLFPPLWRGCCANYVPAQAEVSHGLGE